VTAKIIDFNQILASRLSSRRAASANRIAELFADGDDYTDLSEAQSNVPEWPVVDGRVDGGFFDGSAARIAEKRPIVAASQEQPATGFKN
jgi:hypothetical protein